MSRSLFGIGAEGQLIVTLQSALRRAGFDPLATDGLYGSDTAAAVRAYQGSVQAAATGTVTDEQWQAVTDTDIPALESRALQLTSTFEGHGFGLAQGNWDGAWLTWGIIGFTLKHGEVQAIIASVDRIAPHRIDEAFGRNAATLRHIIAAPPAEQEAWANAVTVGARVAEPWRTCFAQFGSYPEVQAEQCARVHRDYFVPALRTAAALGLTTELGAALCFDIHVQNGGVSAATREAVLRANPGAPEASIREALASAVADRSRPRFQADVLARKLAIARGEGVVHGRRVVLERWGLGDVAAMVA